MPELVVVDPVQSLLVPALLVVGGAALTAVLWTQLLHRSRRFGGGYLAAGVMLAAVAVLVVALAPGVLPFDIGIVVMLAALIAILRPEDVVRLAGGSSLRYRALREGRELQLLLRERGGWSVARRNEEVVARHAGLAAFEGPGTERYVGLLRDTLLADPDGPGVPERRAELEAAEAELRASLGARPMFERDLERRAAALDGGVSDGERSPS